MDFSLFVLQKQSDESAFLQYDGKFQVPYTVLLQESDQTFHTKIYTDGCQ